MSLIFIPLLFFFAAAVFFIHEAWKYTRLIGNIFLSLVYSPALEPFGSSRGERITILDSSQNEIPALLVEKKDSARLVIFCHESGATKDSWEKYASFLPDKGYSILSVGFEKKSQNGSPNTLAQWPTEEDVANLVTVIRWAKKAFRQGTRIFLFGVSNGADIALAASSHDPAVAAVIADGLFSMKEILRDYIRRWAPILVRPNFFGENYPDWVVGLFAGLGFWRCQRQSGTTFVDVEKFLKKPHVPLLMVHGEEDDYVPPSHQRFLDRLSGKERGTEHLTVPQAGHNQAIVRGREVYEEKIVKFLERLA
ncbi:MAG: alpha/beta fold hydrolase [Candidatus Omnitrophica bacterium]|nr:alpha/beta fold hydrolase [Candidatus Omnitrophota bacterium]